MLKNLKQLRNKNGLSMTDVAESVGISVQRYSNYEKGIRQADYDTLIRISNFFNVSINYLLGSQLPVNINSDDNKITIPIQLFHLSSYDKRIDNSQYPVEFFHVPKKWIKGNTDNYFLSYAIDDSMINTHIVDGSLLLFKRQSYLENDQIGAFCLNDKEYIRIYKKLNSGTILLQSANSKYEDIEVTENDDFKIIGALMKTIINH